MQVYLRVSNRPDFDYLTYVRANAAYEAAFREEALRNLRRSPGTYLGNAVAGVVSLCLDINSVFLKAWEYRQTTGMPPQPPGSSSVTLRTSTPVVRAGRSRPTPT